jgi:hypothetical protein
MSKNAPLNQDHETLAVRFHVDRNSLNRHLGNISKATLKDGMTELLGELFGTLHSYCDRCGSGTSEETDIRGRFEIIPDPDTTKDTDAAARIAKLEAALRAIKDCAQEDVVKYIQEVDAIACDALDVDADARARNRTEAAEEYAPETVWVDPTSLDADDMVLGSVKAPKEGGYLNCDLPYVPQHKVVAARIETLRVVMNLYRAVAGDEREAEETIDLQIAQLEAKLPSKDSNSRSS